MAYELDYDTSTDIGEYVKDWEDNLLSEGMLDTDIMSQIYMTKNQYKGGSDIEETVNNELIDLALYGVPEGMERKKIHYLNDIMNAQFYDPKKNMFSSKYYSPKSGNIYDQWRPHHSVDPRWLITDQNQINERYKTYWPPWGNAGYDMGQALKAGYGNVDPRKHLRYEPLSVGDPVKGGGYEITGGWQKNPNDVITDPTVQNYAMPPKGAAGFNRGGIASLMV